MRTTVDIPESIYRQIKIRAATEGTTVRQLMLLGAEWVSKQPKVAPERFVVPVIPSRRPGTLQLTNEQIDELTAFS